MLPGEHSAENGDQNLNISSLNSLKPKRYILYPDVHFVHYVDICFPA